MFNTEELADLHAAVQAKRKETGGGDWLKILPDFHEKILEAYEEYRKWFYLEQKLQRIIQGKE